MKTNDKAKPVLMYKTSDLSDTDKRKRVEHIVKIRNYIDCFADYDIISELYGDQSLFKQSLYGKDNQQLRLINEEIQIGLDQSKDYENFMQLFSTTLKT